MRRSRSGRRAAGCDAAGDAGAASERAHTGHQGLVAARVRAAADEGRGVYTDAGSADAPPLTGSNPDAPATRRRGSRLLARRLFLTRVFLLPASSSAVR